MSENNKEFQQYVLGKINKLPPLVKELIEHNATFIHSCRENMANNKVDIEHIIQQLGIAAGIKLTVSTQILQTAPIVVSVQEPSAVQTDEIVEKVINNKKKLFLPSQVLEAAKVKSISNSASTPNDKPRNNMP